VNLVCTFLIYWEKLETIKEKWEILSKTIFNKINFLIWL